jgi:Ca-activated chloride channel family protein
MFAMNRVRLFLPLLWLLLSMVAFARTQDIADTFLKAEGYEELDVDGVASLLDELLPPTDSVFGAAANVGALAKAALVIEAVDGVLPRARFYLSMELVPESGQVLVQADRYNLGPAVRAQLLEELDEAHVAPAELFGVGPHVSIRLVVAPMMGHRAALLGAARAELSDADAAATYCLLAPCSRPHAAVGHEGFLAELEPAAVALQQWYGYRQDGLPTASTLLGMLSDLAGLDEYDAQEYTELQGATALLGQALVEADLGQDASVDGFLRRGILFDDSVSATWLRLVALPGWAAGQPLYGDSGVECLRGEPQEGLCP